MRFFNKQFFVSWTVVIILIFQGFFCAMLLVDYFDKFTDKINYLSAAVKSNESVRITFMKILYLDKSVDLDIAYQIAESVVKYSRHYLYDPNLVIALIRVESAGFNPNARSEKGAVGLMQLMAGWVQVYEIDGNLTDIDVSIKYGLKILRGEEIRFNGNMEHAILSYNRGPNPIDIALARGYSPNNGYYKKVMSVLDELKKLDKFIDK